MSLFLLITLVRDISLHRRIFYTVIEDRLSYSQISLEFLGMMHSGGLATVTLLLKEPSCWRLDFFVILSLKFRPLSSRPMGWWAIWSVVWTEHAFVDGVHQVGYWSLFSSVCFIWKALDSSLPDLLHKSQGSRDSWETSNFGSCPLMLMQMQQCSFGLYITVPLDPPFNCTDFTTACFQISSFDNLFTALIRWAPSLSSPQQFT